MALIKMDWNPPQTTLRTFGVIGLVAFPLLALAAYYQFAAFKLIPDGAKDAVTWALLALGVYSAGGALIAPIILKPLFVGMSIIGVPIGLVVSYVMLGAIYFLIVTPIALVFKIIGRDAMTRRFDPAAETYWIKRKPATNVKRYFRQF